MLFFCHSTGMFYTDQSSNMYYYEDHYDLDVQGNPAREPRTDTCREVQVGPLDYSNALDLSLNHALDLTAKTQVSLYSFFRWSSPDASDTINSLKTFTIGL